MAIQQLPETILPIQTSSFPFPVAPTGAPPTPLAVRSGIFVYGSGTLTPIPTNEAVIKGELAPVVLNTDVPHVVLIHTRQSENLDRGFHDQFATQVIETGRDFVRFRIKRLDQGSGWGQHLLIDLLIIDDAAPPPS